MGAGEAFFNSDCDNGGFAYGGVVAIAEIKVEDVWLNIKCFQCDDDIIYEGEDHLVECKCKCKTRVFFKKDIEDQDRFSLPQRTMMFNNTYKDVCEWAEKGFQRGYWLVSDYYELKEMVLSEKQSV